ncbi:TMEM175 family protein [Candidatus Binatus sp.]|jgi:hypothetical protein|uniref:TMEM175 family protein n=1 Tax=Candidatus Binatus sp. TaxID=2811406 RepID=UPI003BD364A9
MTASDTTFPDDGGFRLRGQELSRVEALSDVVFGFALTLLGVSAEVPKTFDQLLVIMREFPAFAICFAILISLWHDHYRFFRRYGLQDRRTIFLNGLLLFIVILYVYPLKFLFSLLVTLSTTAGEPMARMPDGKLVSMISFGQAEWITFIYGLGVAAVYAVLALLYAHAFRLRDTLHLNPLEAFETRERIIGNLLRSGLGLTAAVGAVALGGYRGRWAGYVVFGLIPVVAIIHHSAVKRGREKLIALATNSPAE